MRKISFLVAAALCVAAAANAQKEKRETVEGNGHIVTKEIPVSSFESLKASGVYELKLLQGGKEAVKIEADENLQQYFNVHNEGKQLVIEMKDKKLNGWKGNNKIKVYVTFQSLTEMDLSLVGNVTTDAPLSFTDLAIKNKNVGGVNLSLSATHLTLNNNSVGDVRLTGKAQSAVFKNNGVGSLEAGSFVVQTVKIDNDGVGGAEVNAQKELNVSDNMLGRVKNKGAAPAKKKTKVDI